MRPLIPSRAFTQVVKDRRTFYMRYDGKKIWIRDTDGGFVQIIRGADRAELSAKLAAAGYAYPL